MSKKSHKKGKSKRQRKPNISPLALLRPRLDQLLGEETLMEKDSHGLKAELDGIFEKVKGYDLLPVLLSAYNNALEPVQERLDEIVPDWLNEHGYVDTLLTLLKRHSIKEESRERAMIWLESAGEDPSHLQELQRQTLFYQAYTHADDSQGLIIVFWYTDMSRRKVRGMSFLLDFNPPWEGAIKDIMVYPTRSPEKAIKEHVEFWRRRGMALTSVDEGEVKKKILERLRVNRSEGIRLPRDLIRARNLFLDYVLTLSDRPDTPPFTVEDFNELSRKGESPEKLTHFEQEVGRRIRLEDGSEALIMGDPFDDEEDW